MSYPPGGPQQYNIGTASNMGGPQQYNIGTTNSMAIDNPGTAKNLGPPQSLPQQYSAQAPPTNGSLAAYGRGPNTTGGLAVQQQAQQQRAAFGSRGTGSIHDYYQEVNRRRSSGDLGPLMEESNAYILSGNRSYSQDPSQNRGAGNVSNPNFSGQNGNGANQFGRGPPGGFLSPADQQPSFTYGTDSPRTVTPNATPKTAALKSLGIVLNRVVGYKAEPGMFVEPKFKLQIHGHKKGHVVIDRENPVGTSSAQPCKNETIDFGREVVVVDNVDQYQAFEIVLEDAGMFMSDFIQKFSFDVNHESIKLEQPVIESMVDFRLGTPTRSRIEFASIRNVLLQDQKGGGDNSRFSSPYISPGVKPNFTLVQAQEHDYIAALEIKAIDDLPNPQKATTAAKILINIMDSTNGKVLETIGPIDTTKAFMSFRRAQVNTKVGVKATVQKGHDGVNKKPLRLSVAYVVPNAPPEVLGATGVFHVTELDTVATLLIQGQIKLDIKSILLTEREYMVKRELERKPASPNLRASKALFFGGISENRRQTEDMAETLLIAARAQERALEKRLDAKRTIERVQFREWKNLDDLFSSLGAHPVTRSNIYSNRVVRGRQIEVDPLALQNRVTPDNAKVGLMVRRGVNWCWGDEDGGVYMRGEGTADTMEGEIVAIDEAEKLVTVLWKAGNALYSHYRIGRNENYDLALVHLQNDPIPLVCENMNNLKVAFTESRKAVMQYISLQAVAKNPEAMDTLGYSNYLSNQDPKVHFWDANPGYRIDNDIWGQAKSFGKDKYVQNLFVQNCVRQETVLC